jgi:hypothetical protein
VIVENTHTRRGGGVSRRAPTGRSRPRLPRTRSGRRR